MSRVHPRLQIADETTLEDVLCVLNDAAQWLQAQGIENQWPPSFEEDGWRVEKLREQAALGNVVLVKWDKWPLATVTLTDWADPDFADAWPGGPGGALYLLRLATTRLARRLGLTLGTTLIEHAVRTAGERGLGVVRLDCSKANTALHRYYENHGFVRVGTVDVPHRRSGALFQRGVRDPETVDEPNPAGPSTAMSQGES